MKILILFLVFSQLYAIHTPEDQARLKQFGAMAQKEMAPSSEPKIPHTIHLFWIGPKHFSREQKNHILRWVDQYPNWTIKLWTDRKRKTPHPKISVELVDLSRYYSSNLLEIENLLSYDILYKEGGVAVHPDVADLKELEYIHSRCSFYAFLAPPEEIGYSSSIFVGHHIIGAAKNHSVLKKTIQNVEQKWNRVQRLFLFPDQQTAEYRLLYRTWASLDEAILQTHTPDTVIFPSDHLDAPKSELFKGGILFEDEAERLTRNLEKKMGKIHLLHTGLLLSILLCLGLYVYRARMNF